MSCTLAPLLSSGAAFAGWRDRNVLGIITYYYCCLNILYLDFALLTSISIFDLFNKHRPDALGAARHSPDASDPVKGRCERPCRTTRSISRSTETAAAF